jgi:aminopeptidase-like protein
MNAISPTPQECVALAQETVMLCRAVYPVEGLVVSPALDAAFAHVSERFPEMQFHAWPTGATAGDWVVPTSWRAVRGHLKSASGETIASLDESFLFVAPYSRPIDAWFGKAEIAPRCRTRPDSPTAYALEHRYAYDYSLSDWGITLPHERWVAMRDDERYHVLIETAEEPGSLRVAEWTLPGESPEIVCVCSQFDELCNDGQSSAIAGALVFERLARLPRRRYTYQLLLVPELFGAIFYAFHNLQNVRRTLGMLNLETLGAGHQWCLKRAHKGAGIVERALRLALRDAGLNFKELDFFEGYGNDERIYAWPSLGVPGPALQRHPFEHYHTSFDTPDALDETRLSEAFDAIFKTIEVLETDSVPRILGVVPPWLTRHGLYVDRADKPNLRKLNDQLLYAIDGIASASELAERFDLAFRDVKDFLERCARAGILDLTHAIGAQQAEATGSIG